MLGACCFPLRMLLVLLRLVRHYVRYAVSAAAAAAAVPRAVAGEQHPRGYFDHGVCWCHVLLLIPLLPLLLLSVQDHESFPALSAWAARRQG
jgi:hypothetical protein